MTIKEMMDKTDQELAAVVQGSHQQLAGLAIDLVTRKATNHREARELKRTIARAKTIQRQREISELEQTHA
jgi:ribosomal protein L29